MRADTERATEATVPSGSGELGSLRLWLAVLSGAVAWGVHLGGSYALVHPSCVTGVAWILHAVTILTLLPTLWGVWVCVGAWRRHRAAADATPAGRRAEYQQFLGAGGTILNLLFAFAIVLEGLPVALMSPCLGGL